jgi:hypothetical protein
MALKGTRNGAAVVLLLVLLTGCGSQPHEDAVISVAEAFHRAFAEKDGAAACAELAPKTRSELEQSAGKPCAEAVLEEPVSPSTESERVEVFGTQALVGEGKGVTFLAHFPEGWKVMAAACRPSPGEPYDCSISGG